VGWYWAALVGSGRLLVVVRDHEVALPRHSALEVRAEGLWSALNCETPHDHWSIGLEAFAVALDDAAEAFGDERGERTALGLDLEWEASAPVFTRGGLDAGGGRYEQACSVYGDVLVGDERLDFSGWGRREHWWGIQDWWAGPSSAATGRLDDGRIFAAWPEGGYLAGPDGPGALAAGEVVIETVVDPGGMPVSATVALGQLVLGVTPIGHAPVLVEGPSGKTARLARSLCRYRSVEGGVAGAGWAEWLG
jgi:hypothetical protein